MGDIAGARERMCIWLLPFLLFVEQILWGADGFLLASAAALTEIAVVIGILLTFPSGKPFWSGVSPFLVLSFLMLVWMMQPVIMPGLMPGRSAMIVAPDLQLGALIRLAAGLALMIGAAIVGFRRGAVRSAITCYLFLGIVAIAVGIGLRQFSPHAIWGVDKGIMAARFTGTMLNANANACLSTILVLLAIGRLLTILHDGASFAPTRAQRIAPYLACLAIVAGISAAAVSGSRTALGALLLLSLGLIASDHRVRRHLRTPKGKAALIATAGMMILLVALLAGITIDRFNGMEGDTFDRLAIWGQYWRIGWAVRWTGHGLLSFDSINIMHMRSPLEVHYFWYIHSPHDWILSLLIAGGIPYLLLMIAICGVVVLAVVRAHGRRRVDPLSRALVAANLAILIFASVDVALDVPVITATMAVLGGLLYGRALRSA